MKIKTNIFNKTIARILFLIPGILLLCLFQKCTTDKKHNVQTAFYYWKTNFHLNTEDKALLKGANASAIYLRLFDVDWNTTRQKALPIGVLQAADIKSDRVEFIPVVYITQASLQKLTENDMTELSANISLLISSLCGKYNIHPKEIQIDCDWTKSTAAVYFRLLKQLKSTPFFQGKLLSCTIRLHQVKFATSSGIPPVDKGLLMVYNMGNLTRYGGHNSILNVEEAKNYLKHVGIYPLKLDVALPVYHWAVLFENSRFKGITYNIAKEDFNSKCIVRKEGNLYNITADITAGGYSFKKGQQLRFEAPDRNELETVASFLSKRIKDDSFRLSFFHLDSHSIKPFTAADLNDITKAIQ
jgi:hypothetical protein